jgi:hypothetical protein
MSVSKRTTRPVADVRGGEKRSEPQSVILTVSSVCTSSEPVGPRASVVYTSKTVPDSKPRP